MRQKFFAFLLLNFLRVYGIIEMAKEQKHQKAGEKNMRDKSV